MKKLICIIPLLCSFAFGQASVGGTAKVGGTATFGTSNPTTTTFTHVQHVGTSNSCPNTTSCTITVSSTCSTCVGIIFGMQGVNVFISSVSGAGTWIVPAGCQLYNGGIVLATSCAYNLSETSGTTSLVVTWNGTNVGGGLYYVETSWTGATPTIDTSGATFDGVSGGTQVGQALTLTGTSDFIVQGIASQSSPSAITGSYLSLTTIGGGGDGGGAYIVNTSSGSAPTWTTGAATESVVNAIAIK